MDQKHRKQVRKGEGRERYQILLKMKKKKNVGIIVNIIKISLRNKSNIKLSA